MEAEGKETVSLLRVVEFKPGAPETVILKTGIYQMTVIIEDSWGATTSYKIPGSVVVRKFAFHFILANENSVNQSNEVET